MADTRDLVYPLAALLKGALCGYARCDPSLPAAAERLRDALGLRGGPEWRSADIAPLLRAALVQRPEPLLGDLATLITETRRLGVLDLPLDTGAMLDTVEQGLGVRWPEDPGTVTEKLRHALGAIRESPASPDPGSPYSRLRHRERGREPPRPGRAR